MYRAFKKMATEKSAKSEAKCTAEIEDQVEECWKRIDVSCTSKTFPAKEATKITTSWETVNLFVSSTFKDMFSEREVITKTVLPELREYAATKYVEVVETDLRWGVPKDTSSEETIRICLDELLKCQEETNNAPFFINLLGDRYGWVPDSLSEEIMTKYNWVQGISITHMEILLGYWRNQSPNALFCIRDSEVLDSLPAEKLKDFRDDSEYAQEHLRALKERIRTMVPAGQRFDYAVSLRDDHATQRRKFDGYETFARTLIEFFKDAIDKSFDGRADKALKHVDAFDKAAEAQRLFRSLVGKRVIDVEHWKARRDCQRVLRSPLLPTQVVVTPKSNSDGDDAPGEDVGRNFIICDGDDNLSINTVDSLHSVDRNQTNESTELFFLNSSPITRNNTVEKSTIKSDDSKLSVPLMLIGDTGSGKTTLIDVLANILTEEDECYVDVFFVDRRVSDPSSNLVLFYMTRTLQFLWRHVYENAFASVKDEAAEGAKSKAESTFKKVYRIFDDGPSKQDSNHNNEPISVGKACVLVKEGITAFFDVLDRLVTESSYSRLTVALLVDGFDQWSVIEENHRLLEHIPFFEGIALSAHSKLRIHFVCSSLPQSLLRNNYRLPDHCFYYIIPEMGPVVREHLAVGYLGRYNKKLDNEQLHALVNKAGAGYPLWLTTACEELRVYGDFGTLSGKIAELPEQIDALLTTVLQRIIVEAPDLPVGELLCLLEAASDGLELEAIDFLLSKRFLKIASDIKNDPAASIDQRKAIVEAEDETENKLSDLDKRRLMLCVSSVVLTIENKLNNSNSQKFVSNTKVHLFHSSAKTAVSLLRDNDAVKSKSINVHNARFALAKYYLTEASEGVRQANLTNSLKLLKDAKKYEEALHVLRNNADCVRLVPGVTAASELHHFRCRQVIPGSNQHARLPVQLCNMCANTKQRKPVGKWRVLTTCFVCKRFLPSSAAHGANLNQYQAISPDEPVFFCASHAAMYRSNRNMPLCWLCNQSLPERGGLKRVRWALCVHCGLQKNRCCWLDTSTLNGQRTPFKE